MKCLQRKCWQPLLVFALVIPLCIKAADYSSDYANGISWIHTGGSLGRKEYDKYYPTISTSTKGDITIPLILGGNTITTIFPYAFNGCTSLTSVSIPDTITTIGEYAFHQCGSITNLVIPESVQTIGDSAFAGCTNLISITLPSHLNHIAVRLLNGCRNLREIQLPNAVTNIGDHAFSNDIALETINIPDRVKRIGTHAFYNCANISQLRVPQSIRRIESYAFLACTKLKCIEFEGDAPESSVLFGLTVNSNCCSYVRKSSSGWNVDIPGIWKGALIDYARYSISFDANGGSGEMPCYAIYLGEETTLPTCEFSWNDYAFAGWARSSNGEVEWSDTNTVLDLASLNESITLYAKWASHTPVITLSEGITFANASQIVNITCGTAGATVLYTTDGRDPLRYGHEYKFPFSIYESCRIRTVAIKNGLLNSSEASITLTRNEGLSEAVNLYGYLMETEEGKPWTDVTDVSHDGVSCVKSGAIGHGGTTWLQTSVRKSGTVSFWWKAACEEAEEDNGETYWYDYGSFLVDGVVKSRIAGNNTGWQFVSVDVPSGGKHILRWEYAKDGATSYSPDCIWLDQVQWIPADGSGYTLTTPEPVPYSWLTGYGLGINTDFETAAKQQMGKLDANGRSMAVWQDYVAGTDPTNPNDYLRAMIAVSNDVPIVTWTPNLNSNGEVRVYTVMGKTNLTDAAWVCPTNSSHRFFKVKVELP